MEASLAHKKAIAISFPFNGWGSWTDDDIATAVQVALQTLAVLHIMNILQFSHFCPLSHLFPPSHFFPQKLPYF